MNLKFKFLILSIFLILSPLFPSDTKDELKESLFLKGEKQVSAISSVKIQNREDLLPHISILLKSNLLDNEAALSTIQLYKSYGDNLVKHVPNYIQDFEKVLNDSNDESQLLEILNYVYEKKEKRLMYGVLNQISSRYMSVRHLSFKILANFRNDKILPYILELGQSDKSIHKYYYLESMEFLKDERLGVHISKLLDDPNPAIRSQAIKAISYIHLNKMDTRVAKLSIDDSNYEVRKYAVEYIGKEKLTNQTAILEKSIYDINEEVRDSTIDSISKLKNPNLSKTISIALIKEQKIPLKLKMLEGLISLQNHGGGVGIVHSIDVSQPEEVKLKALTVIEKLQYKTMIPNLIRSFDSDNHLSYQMEVARILGNFKERSAIPTFLNRLNRDDEVQELKYEIVSSLDRIDDPKVLPAMFEMLDYEKYPEVRLGMKNVIRRMLIKHHSPDFLKFSNAKQLTMTKGQTIYN